MSTDAPTDRYLLILNTCPDLPTAQTLAEGLVRDRLAACVNILPSLLSTYRWHGEIESAEEHLLMIKTHSDRYSDLEQYIQQRHPYELPEIIAVPIVDGLPGYLAWIGKEIERNA